MESRSASLGRAWVRPQRDAPDTAAARTAIDAILATRQPVPRTVMPWDKSALVARFIEKSLAQSSTVDRVGSLGDAPAAVARYLASLRQPPRALVWPELAGLAWSAAGMTVAAHGATDADPVGITGCHCAIAATGMLMLCAAPDRPASLALLPRTHIALVPTNRIVAGMADAWTLVRAELGALPRAIHFIAGPAHADDPGQAVLSGTHGPCRTHLVIVES